MVSGVLRVSRALTGRPRGDTTAQITQIMSWMTAVRLNWGQIGRIVAWGVVNWLLDCACFAMMFVAIDAPIPWKGLLLAYGAGQLAATLPITPGGLGVVEGSITVALVAFGGAETSTAAAVLLYRVISFWMILAIGWIFVGQLALQVRRGRWPRQAMASDVEAGPVAYAGRPVVVVDVGRRGRSGRRRVIPLRRRLVGPLVGLLVGASALGACSAARSGLGTTDESCYLALPTTAKAVGGHGHLAGVRKFIAQWTRNRRRRACPTTWRFGAQGAVGLPGRLHRPLRRLVGGEAARAPGRNGGRRRGDHAGERAARHADPHAGSPCVSSTRTSSDPRGRGLGARPPAGAARPPGGRAGCRSGRGWR